MKYRLTPINPPSNKKPQQKEIRVQHAPGGLKGRWLVNSLSFVVVILAVIIIFVSVGISSYYYSSIRDNLKNRVHSTVSSIRDNFTSTYDQYLSGIRQYALSYEDKDKVELQFIDTSGRIILSTSELTADSIPSTDDADRALWENTVCSWSGDDPMTGERIMSLSEPIYSARGELIGAVRMISSLENCGKTNNNSYFSIYCSMFAVFNSGYCIK